MQILCQFMVIFGNPALMSVLAPALGKRHRYAANERRGGILYLDGLANKKAHASLLY